jgi:hypothetical protein
MQAEISLTLDLTRGGIAQQAADVVLRIPAIPEESAPTPLTLCFLQR